MTPWKRRILLETIIFRFHVKIRGSISCYFLLVLFRGSLVLVSPQDAGIIDLKGFSQLKQLSLRSGGSNAYDAFQFITWWHKKMVLIGTNWKCSLERVMHQNMYIAGLANIYIYILKCVFFTGSKSSHGFVVLQSRFPFWECILSMYVHWILWLSLYSLQPLDLETKTLSVSGCFNVPIKVRLVSGLKAWQESCKRHDKIKNVLVKCPCFKCLINQCQDLES